MKEKEDIRNGSAQIVVLPNGFVIFGLFNLKDSLLTIKKAFIIRQWGTTKGLGEIALGGPTEKTVLDYLGVASTDINSVIFTINCNIINWRIVLKNASH